MIDKNDGTEWQEPKKYRNDLNHWYGTTQLSPLGRTLLIAASIIAMLFGIHKLHELL